MLEKNSSRLDIEYLGGLHETALLKLTDDKRIAINAKMVTLLHFLSKAFGTISSSKLIAKLRDIGFFKSRPDVGI